jgi:predicted nucleic acid-binding protein
MHLLIDTNIFIYREDDRVVTQNVSNLLGLLNEVSVDVFIHPASVADIQRDTDQRRRDVMLSKLRTYRELSTPPTASKDSAFVALVGEPKNPRDRVDNEILYAVNKGAVDFLITEDAGIHQKAFTIGVSDRILHIDDALEFFKRFLPKKEKLYTPPALKEDFMYNLNLDDPFFDTLKREYPRLGDSASFEEWFKEKSRDHRKCYVSYQSGDRIGALLIKKFEEQKIDAQPPLPKKNRLKIATLKVTDYGHKIGELLLKLSFDSAVQKNIDEIYLTHFTQPNDRLVALIQEYGFVKVAVNPRGEDIFLKKLVVEDPSLIERSPREIYKRFYPTFYDGAAVKKWIIPIRPEFHQKLFTDVERRQTTLAEHGGGFLVEGNAIRKAYLCNAKTKRMAEGDIVLFYRSVDVSAITSLGVVEEVYTGISDTNLILRLVGKRTVYSPEEIEMFDKPLTIVLFRHIIHLETPLTLDTLKSLGVLKTAPMTINNIPDDNYRIIKAHGGINGRFTVN